MSNMTPKVATYVFLDLETTGLPPEECNKTKITELSMVAVCREHLLETRAGCTPRVQDKLTLCFNPQKMVSSEATNTTGLDNYLLEHKSPFNKDICCIIKTFLNVQPKPVCLIAQNGMGFDFPILKNHFERNEEGLSEDVMCADCYHGFYDILEKREEEYNAFLNCQVGEGSAESSNSLDNSTGNLKQRHNSRKDKVRKVLAKAFCDLPAKNNNEEAGNKQNEVLKNYIESIQPNNMTVQNNISPPILMASETRGDTSINDNFNELDSLSTEIMKLENESTPKKQTKYLRSRKSIGEIRDRRFPWPYNKRPKKSYKLGNIYERVLNHQATEAHRAENDCIYALEISSAINEEFVKWVDENCCPFTEIKPMRIGVKVGF